MFVIHAPLLLILKSFNLMSMEWVSIDSIIVDDTMTRSLKEIRKKEAELDTNNIPAITIDINGKIIDGVKRYLVLIQLGFEKVPVNRVNKRSKIQIEFEANCSQSLKLAG